MKDMRQFTPPEQFQLAGSNNEERTIDFIVDGKRYRYYYQNHPDEVLRTYRLILPRSRGKAFTYIKTQSYRYERLPI
jgi:hypothetical protein